MRRRRLIQSVHRLDQLRLILGAGPHTYAEIVERMGASKRSVQRWVKALEEIGTPISEDNDSGVKRIWIEGAARNPIRLGPVDLISLEFGRIAGADYRGLGFQEGLDDLIQRLEKLASTSAVMQRNLFRERIMSLSHGGYDFVGREDDCDEIINATLKSERLEVRHVAVASGTTPFSIEPYGLLLYKKGFYIVGFSHYHQSIRTFGVDGLSNVQRRRKDSFERPADFRLSDVVGEAFGMIVGARTTVRLRFDAKVARFVRRRLWHPSQTFVADDRGLEMQMQVDGTTEMVSWILSFGSTVEVLAPETLRKQLRSEHERALSRLELNALA